MAGSVALAVDLAGREAGLAGRVAVAVVVDLAVAVAAVVVDAAAVVVVAGLGVVAAVSGDRTRTCPMERLRIRGRMAC